MLYSYAGRVLFSNIPFRALASLPEGAAGDVIRVHLGSSEQVPEGLAWDHHWRSASDDVELSVARLDGGWLLGMPGVANFHVDRHCEGVTVLVDGDIDPDTLEHALIDQILPRLLARRGEMVVHAAAARIDARLALFLGDSGHGKSTLAAALDRAGHQVLSDDCVILGVTNAGVRVLPTYPSLRLMPDSLESLYPGERPTQPMADYSAKRRIELAKPDEMGGELSAIFQLDSSELDGVVTEASTLSPASACIQLAQQSFAIDPTDLSNAGANLARSAKVAGSVPGFRLRYSRRFARLPEVLSAVEHRMRNKFN